MEGRLTGRLDKKGPTTDPACGIVEAVSAELAEASDRAPRLVGAHASTISSLPGVIVARCS